MHDPRCRALCSAFHISEITETVSREEVAWSGSSTMTDIDHDSYPPSRCSPAKPASPERTISTANRGHGEGSRKFATSKVIPSGVWSLTSRKLAPGHIRNPRLRGQDGIWRFGRNHGTTGGAALHDRATGEQQTFQTFLKGFSNLRTRGLWPLWHSRLDTLWISRLSRLFREYLAKRFVGP